MNRETNDSRDQKSENESLNDNNLDEVVTHYSFRLRSARDLLVIEREPDDASGSPLLLIGGAHVVGPCTSGHLVRVSHKGQGEGSPLG